MTSFKEARRRIIAALREGDFLHEPRAVAEGKNLLDTGEVTCEEVIALLHQCRGDQHQCTPHHAGDRPPVHIFRPSQRDTRWYIKAYLIADDSGTVVFISVHKG